MKEQFEIGGKLIGEGNPCFIIAEAGANHDRDFKQAKKLIEVAASAGADAVKFQTYTGARLYSRKTPKFQYLKGVSELPPVELLDSIALPREWQADLASFAAEQGILWFSSPFDLDAVDSLESIGVPAFKIASFEIVDLELIRRCAATGKPVVISTGMSTLGEIEDAIEACRSEGNDAVALLQCVSLYPAPAESMNLRAMATLRQAFGVPVGLSDHTVGTSVAIAAAAIGANLIEKHFTLDRNLKGPDHAFAAEPDELAALVAGIRTAEQAMGDGLKTGPIPEESEEMFDLARRSVVAAVPIPRGTLITREMLTVKRPGWGIRPKHIELVLGREAKVDIDEDEVLTWEMV